jgi:hypothetical protein
LRRQGFPTVSAEEGKRYLAAQQYSGKIVHAFAREVHIKQGGIYLLLRRQLFPVSDSVRGPYHGHPGSLERRRKLECDQWLVFDHEYALAC